MLSFLRAVSHLLLNPGETIHLTVVRRYADAQKHFVGELYVGDGPTAKMIGMSCDNLPLDVKPATAGVVRWGRSFLDPMEPNTILVGSQEPQDYARVKEYFSIRRFSAKRIEILNRFVEHTLESDYADR